MKFKATAEFEWDKFDNLVFMGRAAGYVIFDKDDGVWRGFPMHVEKRTKHEAQRALEAALGIERVEEC